MCTLTWALEPTGFELFFNRDEALSRAPGAPPTVVELDGVSIAAPTDADAGGTWIAANSAGLGVCLLNGYQAGDGEAAAPVSRGLLVRALSSAASCADVARRIRATQLRQYRSFLLAAFEPGQQPLLITWNGRALGARALSDADRPLSSSSRGPAGAVEHRRALLAQLERERGGLTTADLEDFHRSHLPEAGALSVCMHRDDASTVSLTHVRVSADSVQLRYWPGAPCGGAACESVRLRRQAVALNEDPGRA